MGVDSSEVRNECLPPGSSFVAIAVPDGSMAATLTGTACARALLN
jgi:hypothetical protein